MGWLRLPPAWFCSLGYHRSPHIHRLHSLVLHTRYGLPTYGCGCWFYAYTRLRLRLRFAVVAWLPRLRCTLPVTHAVTHAFTRYAHAVYVPTVYTVAFCTFVPRSLHYTWIWLLHGYVLPAVALPDAVTTRFVCHAHGGCSRCHPRTCIPHATTRFGYYGWITARLYHTALPAWFVPALPPPTLRLPPRSLPYCVPFIPTTRLPLVCHVTTLYTHFTLDSPFYGVPAGLVLVLHCWFAVPAVGLQRTVSRAVYRVTLRSFAVGLRGCCVYAFTFARGFDTTPPRFCGCVRFGYVCRTRLRTVAGWLFRIHVVAYVRGHAAPVPHLHVRLYAVTFTRTPLRFGFLRCGYATPRFWLRFWLPVTVGYCLCHSSHAVHVLWLPDSHAYCTTRLLRLVYTRLRTLPHYGYVAGCRLFTLRYTRVLHAFAGLRCYRCCPFPRLPTVPFYVHAVRFPHVAALPPRAFWLRFGSRLRFTFTTRFTILVHCRFLPHCAVLTVRLDTVRPILHVPHAVTVIRTRTRTAVPALHGYGYHTGLFAGLHGSSFTGWLIHYTHIPTRLFYVT